MGEIATLLCYEATRDLPLEEVEIETPITMAKTKVLAGRKLALVLSLIHILERPLIGVVSAYSEIVPGHMNLDKIADAGSVCQSNILSLAGVVLLLSLIHI